MKNIMMWSATYLVMSVMSSLGMADDFDEFRSQEISFEFEKDVLVGTLHLPKGEGPFPLLVVVHGSGPADRTSFGYFNLLAPHFLGNGIAFFSYDKPGVGDSHGDWRTMTLVDRARKNIAAVDVVKSHPEIDEASIGFLGGSQGAWVAPLAAQMDDSISHVVIFSGPSISPREQNIYVVENSLRLAGHPESIIREGKAWATEVMRAAAEDLEFQAVEVAYLQPAADKPWGEILPLANEQIWNYLRLKSPVTGEPDFDLDPVSVLSELETPILAIFGAEDPLVPIEQSVRVYREVLAKSSAKPAQIEVFEGANHVIRVESGSFAPGFTELIVEWTKARSRDLVSGN